ncbi:PGAP2-interacting protein [Actinidia chinensis var. chinensis]|uniref:PGAP2-interacting protein n=1 Tax=Actinidia chinensis var. chinensis TaxID=1590841 RepID=A0A2R6RFQ5_ACTCC|nr:PGAP2-interacting protein [Actinidia chinensis var. chinensis]
MDDISNPFRTYQATGEKVRLINGNGCAVTKLYVVHSRPPNPFCPTFDVCTSFAPSLGSSQAKGLFSGRKMKRRKKNMKYKWYAVEGKVKASLKNGYRWFKRRCSQIIHGF